MTIKHVKISEHLPPDTDTYVCVSGSRKCSFFGRFGVLCFLVTSVLKFAFLPYQSRDLYEVNHYCFLSYPLVYEKKFKGSYFINTGLNLGLRKSFRKVLKCRYDNQTKQGPIIQEGWELACLFKDILDLAIMQIHHGEIRRQRDLGYLRSFL